MEGRLTIGQVARRAGVTAKAIRFYERKRVLPAAKRADNQYRLYDDDAVGMLRFVKQASGLGLTLGEIKEVIAIRQAGRPPCTHVRRLLHDKVAELDLKRRDLEDLRLRIRGRLSSWRRQPSAAAVCHHIERRGHDSRRDAVLRERGMASDAHAGGRGRASHVRHHAVKDALTIGQVSALVGVTTKAVRFYETKGLLLPTTRAANGYRLYAREAVETLRFVKQATRLGLTLAEVRDIIAIRHGGRPPCVHVRRVLADKVDDLDGKLRDLLDMRRQIRRSLASWSRTRQGGAAVCPHIERQPVTWNG